MFAYSARERIMLLDLSGRVIGTTADHPLFFQGKGWTEVLAWPQATLCCHKTASTWRSRRSATAARKKASTI